MKKPKKSKKIKKTKSLFWHYSQNNSGGFFVGPTDVIIEAVSSEDADQRATASGHVDFDAISCETCGGRWDYAYGKGDPEPMIYSVPINKAVKNWFREEVTVVYLDGSQKKVKLK